MSDEKVIDIKRKVEERTKDIGDDPDVSSPDGNLPTVFIEQCYYDNIMGDANLFVKICGSLYLLNANSGTAASAKARWFKWGDCFWIEETSNSIQAAIGCDLAFVYETLARELAADVKKLEDENKDPADIKKVDDWRSSISKRAFQLKGDRAKKVLGWVPSVAPNMVVDGAEFDKVYHLIACKNGVINLETGECNPGDPLDKLTLHTPHDWLDINAIPHKFMKHLECVLAPPYDFKGTDQEKENYTKERIEYFLRFLGSSLHGAPLERAFIIFYGEHGWNGKGIIMETLLHALGDYAAPMSPAMLLKTNGTEDASKPSPQVLAMKGRRLLFASETDDGDRFSPAKVKLYSGYETQTGRRPYDIDDTHFKPTHNMILLLNDLPYAKADDDAFWDRMHVLRFFWSYKDKPTKPFEKKRNANLEAELKEEAPAILALIVRSYHKYLAEGGLNPPKMVLKEKALYRFREDLFAQFEHDKCEKEVDSTQATSFTQIYDAFVDWYRVNINDNPKNKPSRKSVGTTLGKRYNKTTTKDNLPAYEGIELKVMCPISGMDDK